MSMMELKATFEDASLWEEPPGQDRRLDGEPFVQNRLC